eukprot:7291243-Prymnesium_polylepis.1
MRGWMAREPRRRRQRTWNRSLFSPSSAAGSRAVAASHGTCRSRVCVAARACARGRMTAELTTALPYNGGYTVWVFTAFGTFWGVQESFLSWIS